MQLIAIVGSQLLGHAIRRTAPEKRGRIGVGRAVDAHNIRPGRQSLHRRDKIFHHGVFTVGILLFLIPLAIEVPPLDHTGIRTLIFLAVQLALGPQIALIPGTGGIILVPDIGPNKNRFRAVRLNAAVEIQNQLIIGKGAVPILVNL